MGASLKAKAIGKTGFGKSVLHALKLMGVVSEARNHKLPEDESRMLSWVNAGLSHEWDDPTWFRITGEDIKDIEARGKLKNDEREALTRIKGQIFRSIEEVTAALGKDQLEPELLDRNQTFRRGPLGARRACHFPSKTVGQRYAPHLAIFQRTGKRL